MRTQNSSLIAIGVAVGWAWTSIGAAGNEGPTPTPTTGEQAVHQHPPGDSRHPTDAVRIPESLRIEHEAIHAKLVEATRALGRVGEAARALAQVLHPHFVREEEIALPPLGLLEPLASGANPPGMADVAAMTDSLRRGLPRMLEEHEQIRAAVETLRAAAQEERSAEYVELAEELARHARSEEEIFYPAAILVGDVVRMRMRQKP